MHGGCFFKVFLLVVVSTTGLEDDFYGILGVGRTADEKEIKKAFKKLVVLEHPDKNNDDPNAQEKFIRLTRAYETLRDPILRKKYDVYGIKGLDTSDGKRTQHSWNYYAYNFDIYDDDLWVITVDENEYLEQVLHSEQVWMINFYSPHCVHCHHLAPAWKEIAEEFEGAVRIGVINCEVEWQLCRRIGIKSYPTVLHYPKNSEHGTWYTGKKTYTAITNFILGKLEIDISELNESLKTFLSHGREKTEERPTLIFVCGEDRYCSTPAERAKVAAVFKRTVDVRIISCNNDEEKCESTVSPDIGVIYLPPFIRNSFQTVRFEDPEGAEVLIKRVLELLPEPLELNANDFGKIRKMLGEMTDSDSNFNSYFGWIICFYIGHASESSPILKRLPGSIGAFKLGRINCGRHSKICERLSINRYPMWGVLKPGGAFELSHGKGNLNEIVKFVESSIKAKNVWALSSEEALSILESKNGDETWFLDWYAPWCPPCGRFLREIRKASLEFDKSVVRFGTIDCTAHSIICQRYNIRSYPTAMLTNGSDTYRFFAEKTASNIIRFINEWRHPSVVRLRLENFEEQLGRRKGKFACLVEYFAPWCEPCQRLEPEWIEVARSLSVLSFVKVFAVNCQTESVLCRSQRVQSYPTIRFYPSDNNDLLTYTVYNGQRDSTSILLWISQFFPRKIRDLDPSVFQRQALTDENTWVVSFCVPWSEDCRRLQSYLAIVAQLMEKPVKFGRLNCDVYGTECARGKINFYPTLMAYDRRHNWKRITDGFVIDGNTVETITFNVMEFMSRVNHDEL